MFFFLLAVITSALVSIFMRTSEKHVHNNTTMLCFNYVMCTVLALICTPDAFTLPSTAGIGLAAILGVINGILYLGGFVLLNWNIRQNGVVLSATFMKLGVLVPTLLAVFLFGEIPTVLQLIGIAAAVVSIILIRSENGSGQIKNSASLLLLPLAGGLADSMSKIYETYGSASLTNHFLLFTFLVALVLCAALAKARKQSICAPDVLFGLLIGIPNYFTARFLLLSLKTIPAIIAYPGYSVGTIVLVTLAGVAFFHEKLSRRQVLALCIILAALTLLNL